MLVKITDIGVRDRFRQDLGNIEELAKDFRENGQITPITVRRTSEDDRAEGFTEPYMLVAGGRRFHAALTNLWDDVKAEIFEELPPLRRAVLELHENIMRKDMTWQEQVALKAEIHRLRLIENPNQKSFQTAREIRDSDGNFNKDLLLAKELEANPDLARAGSKKAAIRQMEMSRHVERMTRQSEEAFKKVATIESALKTMDARDFLAGLEPESVDLLYSDPLWGIDYFSQGHKESREGDESLHLSEYDDSFEHMSDVMVDCIPKMLKALKPTGWLALHCGYDAYRTWREYVENYCIVHESYATPNTEDTAPHYCFKGGAGSESSCQYLKAEPLPWIWYRPNSQNRSRYPDRHEDNRYEFLLVVNRGQARLFRQHQGNVLVHDAEYGSRIHAMQKPIGLCQDVISRLTLPRMLVVDPFFGSGALLAGAASLQRRFSGCDLNGALLQPATGLILQEVK